MRPAAVRRLVSSLALGAALVVTGAQTAAAHVSVDAGSARQGAEDALLTFRVPNERADARTVQVDITFPTKTPVGSVKPAAKPGWTVTTKKVTYDTPITTADGEIAEGVGEVVFRATGPSGGIAEGTFDTFQVLVGPLPKGVATLAFPTVQTYSNGDVSSWIQPSVPGSEPDHPAPMLALEPDRGGSGDVSVSAAAGAASANGGRAALPGGSSSSGVATRDEVRTARLIGFVGVGVGAIGLVAAGVAIGRSRRQPTD